MSLPEKFESERLIIERLRYEFAEEIFFSYASKPEATKYVSWPTHKSVLETRTYLNYAIRAWNLGIDYAYAIRIKPTNQLVGSIGYINESGKVQFGYILSPTVWNQGIATEACQLTLPSLCKLPEVFRIWTFTDIDNEASQKVLKKNGLVEEARLSRWFKFVNQGNEPRDCILFKMPDEFLSSNLVTQ